ncbi:hypothetical protein NLJ89_g6882 [Agrocybe chaxingu]|uniref:Integrase core domain-containing protein n=1 Tax=Agrocybe chaxingu TaxID=84603 RepID=A0A9W8JXX2_9AGAR|nr:hypothetical protein NLJ89_g6882 [Agrocybe chaxingu]
MFSAPFLCHFAMPTDRSSRVSESGQRVLGYNQHRERPILEEYPDLLVILQGYINSQVYQKDIPDMLKTEHHIDISLRSVQNLFKKCGIKTTRRNGLTTIDVGVAILKQQEDDPLGRWGNRLIKEKLARQGIHIPRDYIARFHHTENPTGAASRHPVTRKIHHHGLWSIGPNEEWCVDGHEKILNSMGIAVWGIIDKWSRMELALWAVPNARIAQVPPALYLCLVRKIGGMPLTSTSDMGTELANFIPLVTTMRETYQPFLDERTLPAHKAVKSTSNITRERGWRPIWEKELGNVLHEYRLGYHSAGIHVGNEIHEGVSRWLWALIVQLRLNRIVHESQTHRVRYQKKVLLPSGGRREDFYKQPWKWGGEDQLIKVPTEDVDRLLDEFDDPASIQFGTDEMVTTCEKAFIAIGSPNLSAKVGWKVFKEMIDYLDD